MNEDLRPNQIKVRLEASPELIASGASYIKFVVHAGDDCEFEDKFHISERHYEKVFDMPEQKLKSLLQKLNLYDIEMDLVKKKLLVYKTNLDS